MKNEKNILIILAIMILIIVICIIFILGAIYMSKTNNNNDEYDEIADLEEGGEEYSIEHLKDIDFEIINLSNDIVAKIKNVNQFFLDLKEYIYLNGFVQADHAELVNINETESQMILEFKLNDPEETIVSATINLKNDTYTFSDNYLPN